MILQLTKLKLRSGDMVQVIAGKEKGKQGKITKVYSKSDRVLIEGLNKVKRHIKPSQMVPQGGILAKESPIHISNVMLLDPKTNKPTRVGRKKADTKAGPTWVRYAKASGTVIDGAQASAKANKKTDKKTKKK